MNINTHTVRDSFLAPAKKALHEASHQRHCTDFSDEVFMESGICRVISHAQSGRDWIQKLTMNQWSNVSVGNFFEALKSERRLQLVREVNESVARQVDETCNAYDPLLEHKELDDFAIYGSDGHYEQASAHAEKIEGSAQAVGAFYSINLRSHSFRLLDVARPTHKREHDMHALKRLPWQDLRMKQPKGTKVIHAYDPACIDYKYWYTLKTKGIYFISREKKSSTADTVASPAWDRSDPRNTGIITDEWIGVFCGVMMRRVRYHDPATNEDYSFITSEFTLPPGLIAFIYKLRWDIEKVFDEKKNKLNEKKAWAKSLVALAQQALFVCLAHNLLVLLERQLDHDEDISDEKVIDRKRRRLKEAENLIRSKCLLPNPLVHNCMRITQRSLQFIRWLRHCLDSGSLWQPSVEILRPLMKAYL